MDIGRAAFQEGGQVQQLRRNVNSFECNRLSEFQECIIQTVPPSLYLSRIIACLAPALVVLPPQVRLDLLPPGNIRKESFVFTQQRSHN